MTADRSELPSLLDGCPQVRRLVLSRAHIGESLSSGLIESKPVFRRGGLLINAFHLSVGQVVTTCLSMVLSAAVARTLGAAEFGLLYLLTSIATFAYVVVDWGHGPYVTREVALRPHRSGDIMGSMFALRTGMAALVGVLAVAFTAMIGYDLRTRLLAGLLIMCWLPMSSGLAYGWVFRARERMEYDALIQVVLKFTTLVISLACLALGGRLVGLINVYAVAGTITLVVAVALYKQLGFPPLHVSSNTVRELLRDGAPLMSVSLAVAVQSYIDANILHALVPQSVLGWYAAAWVIGGTLLAPATITASAVYPRLAQAAADPDQFREVLQTTFKPLLLLATLGAVGTYLFADFAIATVYGEQMFGPAADILKWLAPALMLIYIDTLFSYAIIAAGMAGQLAKAKFVAVILTTGIEIILVLWFQSRFSNGGIGIVLGMFGGELMMLAVAVKMIRHVLKGAMLIDFLRGLVSGAATIILMRFVEPITPVFLIPLCVLTFLAFSGIVGLVRRSDIETMVTMLISRKRLDPGNRTEP